MYSLQSIIHLFEFQVPRVMSSHNNNSFSSLPFTPSSTSSLSSHVHAQQSIQLSPGFSANKMAASQPGGVSAKASNSWQLSQQQLAPSSGIGGHRKLPTRTLNVTNFRKISNSAAVASLSAKNSEAVSLPIRHWWTAVYHHHGDQHNR